MFNVADIKEHAEVVGADGRHLGTVDRVEGERIKLMRSENDPGHQGHHHFIEMKNIASVRGGRVQLSVNGVDAIQESDGESLQ